MAADWIWMPGLVVGVGLAVVTALLVGSLHRIIGKICRPRDEIRSGTLEAFPSKSRAKFEIIAVPGLGAHPYHTWEARQTQGPNATEHHQLTEAGRVHLLKHLLADEFPEARILNFAHDSHWLIDAPVKTTKEIGECLLREIKAKRSVPHLPLIFIGHSLGGIIIKQALCSKDSGNTINDTSGIIFLGTPHQGSSISIAGALLATMTGFLGSDATLLLSLRNHRDELSNLTEAFKSYMAPNDYRKRTVPIVSFFETKKTNILGLSLGVVVSRDSATVHADAQQSHGFDTDHSGLNKCGGSNDELFKRIAAAIRHLRTPSLLEQADKLIRDKHYTADRLKIERLSGELLSMEQCYINLAIVEQRTQDLGNAKIEDKTPSPFSILVRQKLETHDVRNQVDLAAIFDEREVNNQRILPRRILIRGRAGVGKTTLCKKIVYEFTKGTWSKWNELFDRVLWVPLRNLKLPDRRSMAKYTFEDLFSHEFLLPTTGKNLARVLSDSLGTESDKTLYLLDGLDEVSQIFTTNSGMDRFLTEMLSQPNVIITCRPSAKPPQNIHLELETIGFSPSHVKEYIEKSFIDPETADTDHVAVAEVESFLEERWLIQGLVRIPIQLDALCYIWEDLKSGDMLNTMTSLYKEIELKLWKKDILRLEDKCLTEEDINYASNQRIINLIKGEAEFLEYLAFTGMYNDIIDFDSNHVDDISEPFEPRLFPQKILPLLSFLRTSDPASKYYNRNYHFIHLSFQEYFAARYFVRQWKDVKGQLQFVTFGGQKTETKASSPTKFLHKHKYTARYDIFWRFVAGLLDGSGKPLLDIITTIEEEPLDLLGPTHQRLVMHCLSEISSTLPMRQNIELRLEQWLRFECDVYINAKLGTEAEFPEAALTIALRGGGDACAILRSVAKRASISQSFIEIIAGWLDDKRSWVRRAAVQALGNGRALPDEVYMKIVARLDDESAWVRMTAIEVIGNGGALPDDVFMKVVARLDDEVWHVRRAATEVLGNGRALPDEPVNALGNGRALPDEVFMKVVARLDDKDWWVQKAALETIGGHAMPSAKVLAKHECTALLDNLRTIVEGRLDANSHRPVPPPAVDISQHQGENIYHACFKRPNSFDDDYKMLLERSFEEQVSWYVEDEKSYINAPDGITEISLEMQQNEVKERDLYDEFHGRATLELHALMIVLLELELDALLVSGGGPRKDYKGAVTDQLVWIEDEAWLTGYANRIDD
ncbi:hypothetical protein NQ176_g9048 [Zarea fungicola]|uniref:Uncharacterized protein n=1 Tax=Zarea fungicola TaxID=93591 RepID=A0ACC1MPF9_9HYPO|nr:hypothetical protein NQ176_g9048 [Lecanicillium fungicola]